MYDISHQVFRDVRPNKGKYKLLQLLMNSEESLDQWKKQWMKQVEICWRELVKNTTSCFVCTSKYVACTTVHVRARVKPTSSLFTHIPHSYPLTSAVINKEWCQSIHISSPLQTWSPPLVYTRGHQVFWGPVWDCLATLSLNFILVLFHPTFSLTTGAVERWNLFLALPRRLKALLSSAISRSAPSFHKSLLTWSFQPVSLHSVFFHTPF